MTIEKQTHGSKSYKVYDGTFYHIDTPNTVIRRLEQCRRAGQNVRIFLGDTKTGKAWPDENDVYGRLGRSTGSVQIPLLVRPRASGGPGLQDHCIVAICARDYRNQMVWPYRHPKLDLGKWTITLGGESRVPYDVEHNDVVHARFSSKEKAQRYIDFMTGKRLVK